MVWNYMIHCPMILGIYRRFSSTISHQTLHNQEPMLVKLGKQSAMLLSQSAAAQQQVVLVCQNMGYTASGDQTWQWKSHENSLQM